MNRNGILAAAAMVLAAVPAARAGSGPDLGLALLEQVQPSAEQLARLSTLRSALFDDLAQLKAVLAARRGELRALRRAEQPDRRAVVALEAEVEALRVGVIDRHLEYRAAVRELLTADQRRQIFALVYEGGIGGGPAIDLTHGSGANDASSPVTSIDSASAKSDPIFAGVPNSLPDSHWSNYPYDPTDLLTPLSGGSSGSFRVSGHGCAL